MADLPVPKAEAKPSTSDPRLEAALAALRAAPTAEGVDSAFMIGLWAGRAQAAADIRDHAGPDPSPASPVWAGYSEALRDAARIAEGSDGTRTDRDETTLPASTSGGIHGETPTGGTR